MTVYVNLAEWVRLATITLGLDESTVSRVADLDLADSALHAPAAGFGDIDIYPDLTMKAAVLAWHLAKIHPLPDGNKRCAFATMIVFLRRNGARWQRPDRHDAVAVMLAVAPGDMTVEQLAVWVTAHTTLPD